MNTNEFIVESNEPIYNEAALVSFGKYLLSLEREERLRQTDIEVPDGLPYEESKRFVFDADIANWLSAETA